VVADALSRKMHYHCLISNLLETTLCQEMERLNVEVVQHEAIANLQVESTLVSQIIEDQKTNKGIC
jgi:hypothetical protein